MAEKKVKEAGSGQCVAQSCKGSEQRFSFCNEHFDQFKFGLIKKDGFPVPDFEKKFEHYVSFKKRRDAHKVA